MRGRAALIAALVAALLPVGTAEAARLVRFTTTSRYVNAKDPNVPFNDANRPGTPSPRALPVNVLLPDGYDGKRRFPVLFLLHGHGDTYDAWMDPKHGDLANVAAGFPGIVVNPEAGRGWYTNWWNGGRRGDPAWESYHLDELVPLVRRRFRIRPERRWHAIAGFSMGGEGATYYAEQRPGYFGSVATFSGAISIQRPEWPSGFDTQGEDHQAVYGDPDAQRFYWTAHNPTALTGNLTHTRVFVAVGDGTTTNPDEVDNYFGAVAEAELRRHADDFVNAAHSNGVDVTYEPLHGIHDWPYWRRHLKDAIAWGFFKQVAEHATRWRYSTVSRSSRAWGVRFDFTKPPVKVATFDRAGQLLTGTGSGTVRIRHGGHSVTASLPFRIALP
jgi:S-formylglutathione hydrolase FrmB